MNNNLVALPHERVKQCGAKTRKGTPCKGFAMKNGRCKLHGGKSTGPKTDEGKARIAAAHWKHGLRSKTYIREMKKLRKELQRMVEETRILMNVI